MEVVFQNPPLVELIAELQWLPAGVTVAANDPASVNVPVSMFTPGAIDDLFMRFASQIGAAGFTHSARLVPAGFPAVPFQPVYRYQKDNNAPGSTVFQLGAGIFSAHVTPPYKRWRDFQPLVRTGVDALLAARIARDAAFTRAMVRYIDCFTSELTAGLSLRQFADQVLGVQLRLPPAIESRVAFGAEVSPAIQLAFSVSESTAMSIALAYGAVGSSSGVIMDSSVYSILPIDPNARAVMEFLDGAHSVASSYFVDLTAKLHSKMDKMT
jgi:uncharacterized protein (TIGR04255 family)